MQFLGTVYKVRGINVIHHCINSIVSNFWKFQKNIYNKFSKRIKNNDLTKLLEELQISSKNR